MYYIDRAMNYLFDERGRAPRVSPPTLNRIDADTQLVVYHQTGTSGPKPTPHQIESLPPCTWIVANPFAEIAKAQSEAYYEEIDILQAFMLGQKSEFSAGQWYVVHPVTYFQVRDLSNEVLHKLQEWITVECPNKLFTSKAKQVLSFRKARDETLEEIYRELERRKKPGDIGAESGNVEKWEIVEHDDDTSGKEGSETNEDGFHEEEVKGGEIGRRESGGEAGRGGR
ncbi:hypothetical protein CC86DRAFT_416321 [Ophiobolus disseminans]|uniref:Uncharacterized protein n=1 Tax=Ophiobolus disseminans TaxID=1469910 RepID=A0A6A7A024_9PLEO|nr:hypothetical protein CC86DRAFT_416321 [Ophiobolus disseminans]